jgi:hypothetical protein
MPSPLGSTSLLDAEDFPSLRKSVLVLPLRLNLNGIRTGTIITGSRLARSVLPHSCSPHPPRVSTMASSQPPKGRDRILSTLNVLIQAIDVAKDACGVPPAQIALGSASVLLTMIRVCSPILCEDEPLTHVFLGHDVQRPGLRGAWAVLRWCMPNPLPEIGRETIG